MSPLASLSTRLNALVHLSRTAEPHAGKSGERHERAPSNVDSFMPRKEKSSSIPETSSNPTTSERLTPPSPQLPSREAPELLPTMVGREELIAKAHNLVVEFVWNNKSQPELLPVLSHMILCQPASIDAYLMRSIVRSKRGDIQGATDDCDAILRLLPNHELALLQRTSLLRDSRITSTSPERSRKITEGAIFAKNSGTSPYSILVKHAAKSLIKPKLSDIEEVEDLVASMPLDRCSRVVLTSMYFARWLQTGDHLCGIRASDLAKEVQKTWPDDKVAMSVLWNREGHLGQGCLQRSNPLGYTFSTRQPLYKNYEIRADVFFLFPIEQQHPALKSFILSLDNRSVSQSC